MGLSFRTLPRGNAGLDALRRKRTQSVQNGMRRRASHDNELFAQTDAVLQHGSRDYRSLRGAQCTCQLPPSALYSAMLACRRASRSCTLTSCARYSVRWVSSTVSRSSAPS
ncbi:DUF1534 domain-containing protein [Pseudomonas syringae]|nr:DUF1534 domain-containing protein [Pseudomonas syringae]PYD19701.1 hypothetical protein DND47_03660 [Pseudomonas syringae pv. syringae]MCF5196788.1 DUF1534 domain-containing protein [Pseudomonas syringae]MCF5209730.1 DUF1534 domain-containing protein [Pseudomonas syringae]MCF5215519.1 DUF1534 domain-containing protein [Pseudomonas syringae]